MFARLDALTDFFARRAVAILAFAFALALAALVAPRAHAQVFFQNTRVGSLVHYQASVGTTTALAIPAVSVSSNLLAWKICANQGNTSYVAVGKAVDADTDGVRLVAGQCFDCPNCTASVLKAANVKGGAASQGYAVVQYKQQ